MPKDFICPQPGVWHKIHQILSEAKNSSKASTVPDPPIPLILNGWWTSSDEDKRERWQKTEEWAKQYGFEKLIPVLKDEDRYCG
jgi:hypothetical protein